MTPVQKSSFATANVLVTITATATASEIAAASEYLREVAALRCPAAGGKSTLASREDAQSEGAAV
ncbi:hypothetical protein [Roseomonas elaeocarpi]|uniref:Uncharacterized protein n=1 Tax=Roseomonas elaeocarpi TaxID=907779 RepID=A0ABV6JTR9_9PROT